MLIKGNFEIETEKYKILKENHLIGLNQFCFLILMRTN